MKTKALILLVLLLHISTGYGFENFNQAFYQMQHRYSLGHYKRTIAIAPVALKLCKNPEQKFQILYYKGLALDALQNFWQAEQVFEKAAKIENISQDRKLQARYNQIRSQYANKHFVSALANAEKYSQFQGKPSVLQQYILLSAIESARQLNKNTKALALAQKMAESADSDSAWHYRGIIMEIQILCLMKDYEKAEKLMGEVDITKLPLPMRAEFFAWAGFCYEKDNKPEAAGKLYSWAYEKYSNYYSGLAALRHANLLSRTSKNYNEIARKYAKVLELPQAHPNHKSQAIYKIACIYKEQGNPELAMRYLAQIDDFKYPSVYWQAKIYNLHGDILYREGKNKEAKKYFQACLKLSKPLPASKLYAGEIIAQMEEKVELPAKQ
jgi:tetratricopeptide (TPR) repeat protein